MEIRCPADCWYLSASRSHPPAVVQRQQQRDLAVLGPTLQGLTEAQSRLLLLLGSHIARYEPQDFQQLRDHDIAEAAAALAATLETAGRGLIYEHRPATQPAQHLVGELKSLLGEIGRTTQESGAPGSNSILDRDAAVALRRIEIGAREAAKIVSGREAEAVSESGNETVYRDLLGRLLKAMQPAEQSGPARASSLILP